MKLSPIMPVSLIVLLSAIVACGGGAPAGGDAAADAAPPSTPAPNVVLIRAHDFAFEAPDSIPSGWTTLRFSNTGAQTHFVLLDHLPDGITMDQFEKAIGPAFGDVYGRLMKGTLQESEATPALMKLLPTWFSKFSYGGGVGFVHPGGTAQATVHLDPGTYVLECYVKSPDGTPHNALGMMRKLTVTGDSTAAQPPEADATITFAAGGMKAPAQLTAGRHTVAVNVQEAAQDAMLQNDVHVARLENGQSAQDLAAWMDWMKPEGLKAPAPATFVGGVQDLPVGATGYFTVDLAPGRYAWISENAVNGMVQEFRVE